MRNLNPFNCNFYVMYIYHNHTRPNDHNSSYAHRNACLRGCTMYWNKSIHRPGNSARSPHIFNKQSIENNKRRIHYKFLNFSYLYENNRIDNYRTDTINFKDKHRRKPEGVYVETMALLLIDDTEAGASGRILAIVGASAYRHLLADKGDAYLLTFKAIVAISRRISVPILDFRFHFCRRWNAFRKWRVAV